MLVPGCRTSDVSRQFSFRFHHKYLPPRLATTTFYPGSVKLPAALPRKIVIEEKAGVLMQAARHFAQGGEVLGTESAQTGETCPDGPATLRRLAMLQRY